jgi:hypothetical protein
MDYRNVSEICGKPFMEDLFLFLLILYSADSYIGSDQEFLGRTTARVLKQLDPDGGKYAFVMQWESASGLRQRKGFNDEMADAPSDQEDRPRWNEIERYPYERPYNLSVDCNHMVRPQRMTFPRNV